MKNQNIVWPAMPAPEGTGLLAVMFQLETGQWRPAEQIAVLQRLLLLQSLKHAVATVPYYREKFKDLRGRGLDGFSWEEWRRLPLLTRRDVQDAGTLLMSDAVPAGHGSICQVQSSGSTGTPITGYGTGVSQFFWRVFGLRDHLWHGRDFAAKHAAIRHALEIKTGESVRSDNWGKNTMPLFATGPSVTMSVSTDVATQAKWLMQENPGYLLSYPSNLLALALLFRTKGWSLPGLKEVRTLGETVGPEVRDICREVWGVKLKDMYSSQEVGYLALQCPQHEHYHVQAESTLIEVLDENNKPCPPGGIGRVVVSSLHNYAMPFIRYEIGDYAEVGAPCPCGRGLPVLKRIMGRQRNMLTTVDGKKYWPSFPSKLWRTIAPVRQLQLVQTDLARIKVNVVAERPLLAKEERRLREALLAKLPPKLHISLCFMEAIPRSKSGKYEDFISLVS
jgi:phenylacetate-CoA ligase